MHPRLSLSLSLSLSLETCLTAAAVLAASSPGFAQGDNVIHVWVDPHFGCDIEGPVFNPRLTQACPHAATNGCSQPVCPGSTIFKPNDDFDVNQNGAVLLHAAWPFKTVTRAVSYIPPLPYTSPITGETWKYAIIHCLPGIYARHDAPFPEGVIHPDNGRVKNGETFPIHLPPGVSIQGASALNTIFFLGTPNSTAEGLGPAFAFGEDGATGVDTFIDSVSIYGALPVGPPMSAAELSAIYVGNECSAKPTISNCFIFRNKIGVLIAADHDNENIRHHGLALVNNTFAFNQVGVWNGELPFQTGGVSVTGESELILINSIFDSGLPDNSASYPGCTWPTSWLTQNSPGYTGTGWNFEGIDVSDMTIKTPGPTENFNAFEWSANQPNGGRRYNIGNTGAAIFAGVLNATASRTMNQLLPDPTRNIAKYTGWDQQVPFDQRDFRGVLYIRDLFCRRDQDLNGLIASGRFDLSPMDFRLAPYVAEEDRNTSTPATPSSPNPLVDNGWGSSAPGAFPVTMQNDQVLGAPPGSLPLSQQSLWPFHAWEYDAEGFGNPRMHDHPMYHAPPSGSGFIDVIDIGADELADTVIGGYVYGTTAFSSFLAQSTNYLAANPPDNKYVWQFGPTTPGFTTPPFPQLPDYREIQQQAGTPPGGYSNPPWFDTWTFAQESCPGYYKATAVDITPHLRPDPHPWWKHPVFDPALTNDAANAVWQWCLGGYNTLLYQNPTAGIINPPGTFAGGTLPGSQSQNYQWLDMEDWNPDPNVSPTPVGFGPYGNGPLPVRFDSWCMAKDPSTTQSYDILPVTFMGNSIIALRFSVESNTFGLWGENETDTKNVQSFMVIVEGQ